MPRKSGAACATECLEFPSSNMSPASVTKQGSCVLSRPVLPNSSSGSFLAIHAVESISSSVPATIRLPFLSTLSGADLAFSPLRGDAMRSRWILLGTLLWTIAFTVPTTTPGQHRRRRKHRRKIRRTAVPRCHASHYWVINETQWDGDEMIVDVQTIVKERRDMEPTLSRFLALDRGGRAQGKSKRPARAGLPTAERKTPSKTHAPAASCDERRLGHRTYRSDSPTT